MSQGYGKDVRHVHRRMMFRNFGGSQQTRQQMRTRGSQMRKMAAQFARKLKKMGTHPAKQKMRVNRFAKAK